MLVDGEIDALYHAGIPSKFYSGNSIKRLFDNHVEVEQDYFRRTRIFHIMHTFVIKRELYNKHPWIAQTMYKAMCASKKTAYDLMINSGALQYMLPWLVDHIDKTTELMGADFWPYGLEANRHVLETFLRYSHEQGLSKRLLTPDEIFAPESLDSYKH